MDLPQNKSTVFLYNTTTPAENASEFNYPYGPNGLISDGNGNPFFATDQNWQQVLAFESEIAMRHVLSFSPYPHFFHQNNLKEYAPGRSLIYDWSEAVLNEYDKYFNIPILSQDWEGMTSTMNSRTLFFDALQADAISGIWDRVNNTVFISTSQNATFYVTGAELSSGTQWTYGPDKVSRKWLRAAQSIAGRIALPVANRAPTLSAIADQTGSEGAAVSIAVSYQDADLDYIGFSASNLPPGLAIDPATGIISGTPAFGSVGSYNVIVTASDGQANAQQAFTWTIATPQAVTVFEAAFESSTDGFSYSDDMFRNTSEPNYARGDRDSTEGYLFTIVGGIDNANITDMSGGFENQFSLSQAGRVTITLQYSMDQAIGYDEDEFVQAVVAVDGQLYGLNGQDYLEQLVGGGESTWKTVTVDIGVLAAGNHTIQIGAYNNKKTYNDESTKVSFDDVTISIVQQAN